jgi:hypothetical protein
MSRSDLDAILVAARQFNLEQEITGYLLYDDGHFIQALEGPSERVDALAERIARDDRHQEFHVLCRDPIEVREFADWAMGCFHVDDVAPHDARRLRGAMQDFLDESHSGFREALGFFRLFLRFEREHPV